MASITLQGNPFNTVGDLPEVGAVAPDSKLTKGDLSEMALADLRGKRVILNIFPSIDTPTCATSVRAFNEKAAALDNVAVVCASKDLPFALGRFCGAEGITNVETASAFRSDFGDTYGITIADGPLAGLLARCVVVMDETGTILHTELVSEVAEEPNYEAALKVL